MTVETPPHLAEGLEDVSAGALLRAGEARSDLRIFELVHFPHDEGQPLLRGQPGDHPLQPLACLVGQHLPVGSIRRVRPHLQCRRRIGPSTPRLGPEVVAAEVRGNREEPRAHIRARWQGAIRPERAEKGLLREIIGVAPPRRDPQQVPPDLRVVGSHHRLVRVLSAAACCSRTKRTAVTVLTARLMATETRRVATRVSSTARWFSRIWRTEAAKTRSNLSVGITARVRSHSSSPREASPSGRRRFSSATKGWPFQSSWVSWRVCRSR